MNQQFDAEDFEVIVVNDSGAPLREELWMKSSRVNLVHTNQRERSVARNTGAAVSRGRYLHFLDDDDWLEVGALDSFWALAQTADAAWLYGSTQLVDRQENKLIHLRHQLNGNAFVQVMAGEWIPLQASLILADAFFEMGGFNPLISGPEDIDLLRRFALRYDLGETHTTVANIVRGVEGSTTDYDQHPQQSRYAREIILNEPGVLRRLQDSADKSYWHGRIVRLYLTSLVWNLQNRRLFMAVSRASHSTYALLAAGYFMFSARFWQAILTKYQSEAFARGLQKANTRL